MPDLLGAANPVPGYDKAATNRSIPTSPNNTQIQNIPDPSRVSRPDGRSERQGNDLQGDGNVRYDSSFQTFLQRLQNASSMSESLSRIFAGGERTVVLSGLGKGIAEEMSKALEMLRMNEAELLAFLKDQVKAGTRFSGPLFALLRNAYAQATSDTVRVDILNFLKAYSDYSSTAHIERNILRNLSDMADALPASWASKLRELTAILSNGIAAGDRSGNLALLKKEVIPLMSEYVNRTHDMGLPRSLLSQLALNITRYEGGSEESLLNAFHQLCAYGTLREQLNSIDDQSLLTLLRSSQFNQNSPAALFSSHLAAAAANALRGGGSAEVQQAFENLIAAILVNESVYMPLNHYLLPLEWNGRMLFSEMWVDPDAENDSRQSASGNKAIKFLFKMDVQSLGLFDIVLTSCGKDVDIRISCPEKAVPFSTQIEQAISQILIHNELVPSQVVVKKAEQPVSLTKVFPKIFERKNSVNVKA